MATAWALCTGAVSMDSCTTSAGSVLDRRPDDLAVTGRGRGSGACCTKGLRLGRRRRQLLTSAGSTGLGVSGTGGSTTGSTMGSTSGSAAVSTTASSTTVGGGAREHREIQREPGLALDHRRGRLDPAGSPPMPSIGGVQHARTAGNRCAKAARLIRPRLAGHDRHSQFRAARLEQIDHAHEVPKRRAGIDARSSKVVWVSSCAMRCASASSSTVCRRRTPRRRRTR